MNPPPTLVLRHRRENLKKCSLRGLENREDIVFLKYPRESLPPLRGYVMLSLEGPLLSSSDAEMGLFLLDATWRYASVMERFVQKCQIPVILRSLPITLKTAYPRRQDDCSEPDRGLASVEALYAAYCLMGRKADGILDHYHWRDHFLLLNPKI